MVRICEFPNCEKATAYVEVRGKTCQRKWCHFHMQGFGEKERKEYAKTLPPVQIVKHGMKGTRIYVIWNNMKQRCNNPKTYSYAWYGAKGISYDPKWNSFEGFWKDMGSTYKENLTIDRVDNSKNYSKENCRWVTMKEQKNNTSANRFLTHKGKTYTVAQWSSVLNYSPSLIHQRIYNYGWSVAKALSTPPKKMKKYKARKNHADTTN